MAASSYIWKEFCGEHVEDGPEALIFTGAKGAPLHCMGHGTMRAALIHQHATNERDREIARATDRRITGERRRRP